MREVEGEVLHRLQCNCREWEADCGLKPVARIIEIGDARYRHTRQEFAGGRIVQAEKQSISLAARHAKIGRDVTHQFVDRAKRFVAGRAKTDAGAAHPVVVKLMAIRRAKAYVVKVLGEGLEGIGQNGVRLEELSADVRRGGPFVDFILPNRRRQVDVLTAETKKSRLPLNRLRG